uniref:Uncharacterized protein n=1 Tax=Mycena chlorophos TaxID=658473 RepID=A0ABQ0LLX8_MYCCL|nr:predicted protein [Mycena chlorophos]
MLRLPRLVDGLKRSPGHDNCAGHTRIGSVCSSAAVGQVLHPSSRRAATENYAAQNCFRRQTFLYPRLGPAALIAAGTEKSAGSRNPAVRRHRRARPANRFGVIRGLSTCVLRQPTSRMSFPPARRSSRLQIPLHGVHQEDIAGAFGSLAFAEERPPQSSSTNLRGRPIQHPPYPCSSATHIPHALHTYPRVVASDPSAWRPPPRPCSGTFGGSGFREEKSPSPTSPHAMLDHNAYCCLRTRALPSQTPSRPDTIPFLLHQTA